ncbi:MAG: hypothetical protein NT018_07775, partial [Armatimonadetes bacterium]|nr:hypothetical protein [Armatimonadota bacterium]
GGDPVRRRKKNQHLKGNHANFSAATMQENSGIVMPFMHGLVEAAIDICVTLTPSSSANVL